nr:uncharacterized protein LOC104111081 [Nicotiana tomentosiformis]
MRTVPEVCPNYPPSRRKPLFSHLSMVVHQVGNGHRGTASARMRGRNNTEVFEKWHIKKILSTLYHPDGNGKAESSNKSILNIMKKRLEDTKGLWPEILPRVLWAHRTTPKTNTGETPHSLVYGTEAVILVEARESSLRYTNESGNDNNENRRQRPRRGRGEKRHGVYKNGRTEIASQTLLQQ